jgi:hypothetical protein
MKSKEKITIKTFDKSFWIYIGIFLFLVIVILFFPYLFSQYSFRGIDFTPVNGISNTIGIISPFIAILAAGLTFLAFWVQFKANEQQRYDIKKERFESTFYELLRMHRQNVDELKIDELQQREVFQELFFEFKLCFDIVNKTFDYFSKVSPDEKKELFKNYRSVEKINLAYLIFFYGYKHINNLSYTQVSLPEEEWFDLGSELTKRFQDISTNWEKGNFSLETPVSEMHYLDDYKGAPVKKSLKSFYRPFNGQSKSLGHYYRNMIQISRFINNQSDNFIDFNQRYDYMRMLRAQLSDFEQLLLYYNSLSVLGFSWFSGEKESLIVHYKLIKNIPLALIFELSPKMIFKKFKMTSQEIDEYFEPKNQLLEI